MTEVWTVQQWQDSGSGPGHMQTVTVPKLTPLARAYQAILDHTAGNSTMVACAECRTAGMDCAEAAKRRQTWRDAKAGSGS